jgi:hypothetical protein
MSEEPPGTYEICSVCGWEDDPVQANEPDYKGGANSVSLNEARENFARYGAVRAEAIPLVRRPLPEEIP